MNKHFFHLLLNPQFRTWVLYHSSAINCQHVRNHQRNSFLLLISSSFAVRPWTYIVVSTGRGAYEVFTQKALNKWLVVGAEDDGSLWGSFLQIAGVILRHLLKVEESKLYFQQRFHVTHMLYRLKQSLGNITIVHSTKRICTQFCIYYGRQMWSFLRSLYLWISED